MINNIYIVRHGETDWNVQRRMQGHTDIPLNTNGRAQAEAIATEIKDLNIKHIYTSDLSRAYETAEIINKKAGLNLKIAVDQRLREGNNGDFAGRDTTKITPKEWEDYLKNLKKYNAETLEEIYIRIRKFLDEIKIKNLQDVLIVTHAGTMRMFLYCAKYNDFDEEKSQKEFGWASGLKLGNATIVKLDFGTKE